MNIAPSPTSHSYFSQRLRLHYLDWGNPSAPHLLLIHGMRDHCHNWDWIARSLCDDYHIVAPDLRGHGDSEWAVGGHYDHVDYVYDLCQLIHQARIQPMTIIAHSMGGTLACQLAGLYPEWVDKLVVIEGVGLFRYWERMQSQPLPHRLRQWVDATRQLSARSARRYESLEDAYHRMQETNPHLSPQRARHLTVHGSNHNEDGTYSWKFDNYTHARSPYDFKDKDTQALWQRITCPVLMMTGANGYPHRIGQDETLQFFTRGQLQVIENAGHWVHHDQFDATLTAIRKFLTN